MQNRNPKEREARFRVALGIFVFLASGCGHLPGSENDVAKLESAIAVSTNEGVLGFEDPGAWAVTQGSIVS
ncbi:MAG: hypothetical protein ABIQ16_10375, partial [Polyangiaceae bacterium]